jgi:hypothetical protein
MVLVKALAGGNRATLTFDCWIARFSCAHQSTRQSHRSPSSVVAGLPAFMHIQ